MTTKLETTVKVTCVRKTWIKFGSNCWLKSKVSQWFSFFSWGMKVKVWRGMKKKKKKHHENKTRGRKWKNLQPKLTFNEYEWLKRERRESGKKKLNTAFGFEVRAPVGTESYHQLTVRLSCLSVYSYTCVFILLTLNKWLYEKRYFIWRCWEEDSDDERGRWRRRRRG